MKPFTQKMQVLFSAAAFAEEGDYRTAVQVTETSRLPEHKKGFTEYLTRMFSAVAFAEEGLYEEAQQVASQTQAAVAAPAKGSFLDVVGLRQAPVFVIEAHEKPSFLETLGLSSVRACCVTVEA